MESLSLIEKVYFGFLVGILGLIAGSFINVVALRLLAGENFIKGRSKCPKCGNLISWYDNIPVLSYIILGGKCRNCKEKISFQYPVVEILTSALFLATAWVFGLTLKTLFLLFLTCNLIIITITDIREKYIFDINSIPLIPIGLVYNYFNIGTDSSGFIKIFGIVFQEAFITAIIGAVLGAAFFEFFSRVGKLLIGEYAFGTGDTFLGAALGAWFGWKLMIVILILSFLSQLVIGVPFIVHNMYKDKDYKSLWAMVGLSISLIFTWLGRYFIRLGNLNLALGLTLLSFAIAGWAIFVILKRSKERQSYTFLPFGPSLVLSGFVVMFYSEHFLWHFL